MSKIFVSGDFGYRGRTQESIRRGEGITLFAPLIDTIAYSDLAIVNFESPVGTPAYFIPKCGPSLCSEKEAIKTLKEVGFSLITLANNHFYDCGEYGVNATLNACREYSVDTVGGGVDIHSATEPYVKILNDEKLVIINACETEFSIASDSSGGAAPLDIIGISQQILKYKDDSKVIVIIHGGHEFYQLPSVRMQKLYRFFIELGAYSVINHHQHCYSGYELYLGRPIFYGLGNFLFDSASNKRDSLWNYGYAVLLDTENISEFTIIPYVQSNESAGIRLMDSNEILDFTKKIHDLCVIINDPNSLKIEESQFFSKLGLISVLNPFYNGLTSKLYSKKWFPSFITKKHRLYQLHYLQCESHRDALLYNLKKTLKL